MTMFYLGYILIALVFCQMTFCLTIDVDDVKAVDLTHTLDNTTLYMGLTSNFTLTILQRGQYGDIWFEQNKFETNEHAGSHLDAPSHFAKGSLRIHEIALSNVIGPGVLIDVHEKAAKNPDYLISVDDFTDWERKNGRFPNKSIILLYTGWSKFWPQAEKVFGTTTPENRSTYHFPGLDPNAAKWIVTERPTVKTIGIDTPSMDFGQSKQTQYMSHRILGSRNVSIIEFVANLHELPASNYAVFAIPIKIGDGSGSPARIFALLCDTSSSSKFKLTLPLLLCLLFFIF